MTTLAPPLVTGLPFASLTVTVMTWVPSPAVMSVFDAAMVDCAESAAPAVPVALKVTGEPRRAALVAVSVLAPARVPSFQEPTVAMPAALVTAVRPPAEPPPLVTAKVTVTPRTG